MTIALRAAGAWAAGSSSLAPALPAGSAAGDRMVLFVACKPFGITISTPSGWTALAAGTGTNGSTGSGIATLTPVLYRINVLLPLMVADVDVL